MSKEKIEKNKYTPINDPFHQKVEEQNIFDSFCSAHIRYLYKSGLMPGEMLYRFKGIVKNVSEKKCKEER